MSSPQPSYTLPTHLFFILSFVCTVPLCIHSEMSDEECLFKWTFVTLLVVFTSNYCTAVIWGLDEIISGTFTFTILTFKISLVHPGCISSSVGCNMSWVFDLRSPVSPHFTLSQFNESLMTHPFGLTRTSVWPFGLEIKRTPVGGQQQQTDAVLLGTRFPHAIS